jgi:hypothetical protein
LKVQKTIHRAKLGAVDPNVPRIAIAERSDSERAESTMNMAHGVYLASRYIAGLLL